MTTWEDNEESTCPGCKSTNLIVATGRKNSPLLLVGDEPGKQDLESGMPFSGNYGRILEIEFQRIYYRIRDIRRMYLWQHPNNKNTACFNAGVEAVIRESADKQIIGLMGAQVIKYFTAYQISKVSSLVIPSSYFPDKTVIALPSVSTIFSDLGEFRLALSTLKKELEKLHE